ncbi:MAG: cysteine desulfurase [Candidatus Latescibacteria bacterium]|nr:cysteine desulfurase [Candidatus Latescibacterota bacterium]
MKKRYYFDHNATTPVRPEVLDAMLPYLTEKYGNASSVHSFGRDARHAMEKSREIVATLINADPEEIYFTGCGTESDNIALTGTMTSARDGKNRLITSKVEHSAIMNTAAKLKHDGFQITYIGVDEYCRTDINQLKNVIDNNTALVSIMHGNNETGVLQNIEEAAKIAHSAGAVFHTDAVQSAGKIPIDVKKMGIDMLSMSGHKLNAPKGIGVLYIKKGLKITPLTYGGSHERGIRPGTENVAGIVALAKAVDLAMQDMENEAVTISALRDRLESEIEHVVSNVLFNGRGVPRLPGTSNISFPGVDGEALLFSMDIEGVAASTGSACTTGEVEPSHVLVAMGREPKTAQSSLRFSMGWGTTDAGVDHILNRLPVVLNRLRSISGGI